MTPLKELSESELGEDARHKQDMAERILDCAQELVQMQGYHAFSYADIAPAVGIRKASIHYYFPSKSDLGAALVTRYRAAIGRHRRRIDLRADDVAQRLIEYTQMFRDLLRQGPRGEGGRMCLCGALAANLPSLPAAVQTEVQAFFAENEAWLARVLADGRQEGFATFSGAAEVQAQTLLSGLEGGMLLARVHKDVTRYCAVAHHLLGELGLEMSAQNEALRQEMNARHE